MAKAVALSSAASLPFSGLDRKGELKKGDASIVERKILFTYVGGDGHEPTKFVDYLSPWMKEEGADVHLFKTLDPYTDKSCTNSNQYSGNQ